MPMPRRKIHRRTDPEEHPSMIVQDLRWCIYPGCYEDGPFDGLKELEEHAVSKHGCQPARPKVKEKFEAPTLFDLTPYKVSKH